VISLLSTLIIIAPEYVISLNECKIPLPYQYQIVFFKSGNGLHSLITPAKNISFMRGYSWGSEKNVFLALEKGT
jgi:hypothetical protein